MKRVLLIVLIAFTLMLSGCNSEKKPTGMYVYGSPASSVYAYYNCEEKNKCDWYAYIEDYAQSTAEYEYTIKENEDGTYILHMTNTSSDTNYDVIYDPTEEIIFDSEIEITYEKK